MNVHEIESYVKLGRGEWGGGGGRRKDRETDGQREGYLNRNRVENSLFIVTCTYMEACRHKVASVTGKSKENKDREIWSAVYADYVRVN